MLSKLQHRVLATIARFDSAETTFIADAVPYGERGTTEVYAPSDIRPVLRTLEGRGLVKEDTARLRRRPRDLKWSITPAGREALKESDDG